MTLEGRFCGDRLLEGKKFLGGRLVQTKGFEENGEYVVVNYDALSQPVRRVRFDRDKRWRQTEYYHAGNAHGIKGLLPTVGRIVTRKPVPDGVLPSSRRLRVPFRPFYELRDGREVSAIWVAARGVLPQGGGSLFENQELRYAGAFRSGKRHGFGRSYLPCKEAADNPPPVLEYEGIFADDRYDGPGTLWLADGRTRYGGCSARIAAVWQGVVRRPVDLRRGFSRRRSGRQIYPSWEGSLFHENGTLCFEGEFVDGMVHGEASFAVRTAGQSTPVSSAAAGPQRTASAICREENGWKSAPACPGNPPRTAL